MASVWQNGRYRLSDKCRSLQMSWLPYRPPSSLQTETIPSKSRFVCLFQHWNYTSAFHKCPYTVHFISTNKNSRPDIWKSPEPITLLKNGLLLNYTLWNIENAAIPIQKFLYFLLSAKDILQYLEAKNKYYLLHPDMLWNLPYQYYIIRIHG